MAIARTRGATTMRPSRFSGNFLTRTVGDGEEEGEEGAARALQEHDLRRGDVVLLIRAIEGEEGEKVDTDINMTCADEMWYSCMVNDE